MATFILNDEHKKNSYGFRVATAGISLERFRSNPVLLNQHHDHTAAVLGRWANIRVEDGRLLADDDFDTEDEDAKKLKGKVDRGFLKGCSMGLSFNPEDMEIDPAGGYVLTKCELYEASIVAIPANANAVRLYAADTGALLSEEQVKLSLSAIPAVPPQPTTTTNPEMKQIQLSLLALTALGFNQQLTENDGPTLSAAIERLSADLKAEKEAHAALKTKHAELAASQGKGLIDAAITAGKITEADREEYAQLAASNYSLAEKMLSRLPGKTTLGAQVNNPATGAAGPKDLEEFQKLSVAEQLAFKANQPEAYKKLLA